MTFEQPASLNKYTAPAIPLTWSFRWKLYKLFLPVTFYSVALLAQGVLLREWVTDKWSIERIAPVLIFPFFLLVMMELHLRLQWYVLQKSKRTLRLEENYFRITPPNMRRTKWPQMVAWRFQNLTDDNRYQIATVEFRMDKKGQRLRRRSIVLEKISQGHQLISELKFRQQKNGLGFSIEESGPSAENPEALFGTSQWKRVRPAPLYLCLAAAFLVMEGLPLLLAGLGLQDGTPDQNVKPNPNGSFARWIRRHFSNVAEFKHFCLITGAILCGIGTGLIIWSSILVKRQRELTDKNAVATE